MKRTAIFFLVIVFVITVISCSDKNTSESTESSSEVIFTGPPTGPGTEYPSPEVPYAMVVYDSRQWNSWGNDGIDELPEGFVYVGEVLGNDIYNLPTEELHAAHLPEGTKLFANSNYSSRKRGEEGDDVFALVDGKYIRLHYYECLIVVADVYS